MTAHDVVIVGGGPAGLSAARRLAVSGVRDVVVLEREGEAGGIPRHCGHSGFGIGQFLALPMTWPAYARRLVEATHGIEIRTRTTVTAIEPSGRIHVTHPDSGPAIVTGRCVLLATGVRETPRSARLVSGTRPWGVTTTGALQQFVYLKHAKPFARVVVVGTELVSFSALLTARHAGIAVAAMLEEGERITARRPGDWIARHVFGVPVLTRTRLVAIRGLDKVEGVEIERAGRRETLACDGVVFTGRFQPETAILRGSHIALDSGTGGPAIDGTGNDLNNVIVGNNAANELTKIDAANLLYDDNGNLQQDAVHAYAYDEENRLIRVTRNYDAAIVDVMLPQLDGISLVTTYRSTFAEQVNKGGIDALIKALAEMNAGKSAPQPAGTKKQ
jgi:thioredoxin reductase